MTEPVQTRERILQAVLTLVSSKGLDETSVRTVAAEAGVSIGAVQHHFRTKTDLLVGAMEAVTAAFRSELTTRLDGVPDARTALREFMLLLAAVDDDTAPAVVWIAFAARACVDPAVREMHTRDWLLTEEFLGGLLAAAHPQVSDVQQAAGLLLAVADGLAVARAAEDNRMPGPRARSIVDATLAALER